MADNVVDTMVLVLGLDASKFTQQQKDALDLLKRFQDEAVSQGKRVESQTNQLQHTLGNFKREVLGALVTFAGGIGAKEMIGFITNLDAATGRLSKQFNVNTRELSAWQGVMTQVGGTAQDANSALGALSTSINKIALGGPPDAGLIGVLNQLHVPIAMNGKFRGADAVLKDIARAVHGMDPSRAATMLGMIPGMNQPMLNALLEGPESLEKRLAQARKLGGTSEDDAKRAQQYQEATGNFQRAVEQFGRVIGVMLLPALSSIIEAVTRFLGGPSAEAKAKSDKLMRDAGVDPNAPGFLEKMGSALSGMPAARNGRQYGYERGKGFVDVGGGGPPAAPADPVTQSNMSRFLRGLSFLETDQRNVGSTISSAQGFFQFTTGTARDARAAGIADPRFGSYDQQSGATEQFIRRFHPAAAAAIERGDFAAAQAMLKGRWPSLPGGSQQQSASRYGTYAGILAGAPAAAAAGAGGGEAGSNVTVTIGTMQVNAPKAENAADIAKEIAPQLRRQIEAGSFNGAF